MSPRHLYLKTIVPQLDQNRGYYGSYEIHEVTIKCLTRMSLCQDLEGRSSFSSVSIFTLS